MAICDIVTQRTSGIFVCDNTIKDLTQTGVNGTQISYSLELQDGTKGSFTLDGNDIINLSLTDVPNDATPINFIIKNIVELLNEQTDFNAITEAANSIIIHIATISPIVNEIAELANISDDIAGLYGIENKLNSLYADLDKINSIFADKISLDSIANNLATLLDVENQANLTTQNIATSQDLVYQNEAKVLTANSFSNEAEDTFVKIYSSNGDGTYSYSDSLFYSAKHWTAKAKAIVDANIVDNITANNERIKANEIVLQNISLAYGSVLSNTTNGKILSLTANANYQIPFNVVSQSLDLSFFEFTTLDTVNVLKNANYSSDISFGLKSSIEQSCEVTFEIFDSVSGLIVSTTVINELLEPDTVKSINIVPKISILRDSQIHAPALLLFRIKTNIDVDLSFFGANIICIKDDDDEYNETYSAISTAITTIDNAQKLGILDTIRKQLPIGRVGELVKTTANVPFDDCIKANGAVLSRIEYPELWEFAKNSGNIWTKDEWDRNQFLGYHNGDGITTFGIPDWRGQFERAWDDGKGLDFNRKIGQAQADMFKKHSHQYSKGLNGFGGHRLAGGSDLYVGLFNNTTTGYYNGGSETRPKNGAVLYCIKYTNKGFGI